MYMHLDTFLVALALPGIGSDVFLWSAHRDEHEACAFVRLNTEREWEARLVMSGRLQRTKRLTSRESAEGHAQQWLDELLAAGWLSLETGKP